SEQFFAALKILGVPTRYILFRDEWHGTERNPSNFMRTQLYLMQWFEQYMSPGMKDLRKVVADGVTSGS
ncbi:MAG: alpha/beta hydrolase family protein, partial [Longimicrobiales bacterium]